MSVSLLFPEGLLWSAILLPFAVLVVLAFRAEYSCLAGLGWPPWRGILIAELFLATAAFFLFALALARPAVVTTEVTSVELPKGVCVLQVFDASKSMYALENLESENRLERARTIGLTISEKVKGCMGVAGFTNILALYLFPAFDPAALDMALVDTLAVGSVPSGSRTSLGVVADAADFFPEDAAKKIMVVFTDGDSSTPLGGASAKKLKEAGIRVILVGVGKPGELIPRYDEKGNFTRYDTHVTNFNAQLLKASAAAAGGIYFYETETEKLVEAIGKSAGKDTLKVANTRRIAFELTPLVFLVSFAFASLFLFLRRPR